MTIRSQYSSNCTHCRRAITPGDQVNWVKGIKGVTCVACPPPGVQSAPTLGAALEDGRALRARVGEQERQIETLIRDREELRQIAEAAHRRIESLIRDREVLQVEVTELRAEFDGLTETNNDGTGPTLMLPDDGCPI
jgi:hypothetical protein